MIRVALLLGFASVGCEGPACVGDCEADTDVVGCSLDTPLAAGDAVAETGGLGCSDDIPHLADARVFRAAALERTPVGLDPNGYLVVLSSQPDICAHPVGGFNCSDDFAYRLYLGLPPTFEVGPGLEGRGYEFGPTAGPAYASDIPSWIQIGETTDCCSLTTPPVTGTLFVEAFDPDSLEMRATICSYGYTAELGHGLSGTFSTEPSC